MKLIDILREAVAHKASDVHLVPGAPPLFRVDGQLIPVPNYPRCTPGEVQENILQVLTENQRNRLSQEYCVDFSVNLDDTRFRGNAFYQKNGFQVAFRLIPTRIPTPEEILLPPAVIDLAKLKSGLVLVTGPTGSGKSTTLACLIDLVNSNRRGNIITIEDPIEFVHMNKNCVISQREVGLHATTFNSAIRYVMRQDPDVILVGEKRDLDTISATVSLAETGHLVLATLHAPDAAQAVDRIIDVFPATQQQQIRTQLAGVLRGVVAQTLLQRARSRGRVALREVMIVNDAISNLIRTGKTHEISSAIEMSAREGSISLTRAFSELMSKGLIDNQDVNVHQPKAPTPQATPSPMRPQTPQPARPGRSPTDTAGPTSAAA